MKKGILLIILLFIIILISQIPNYFTFAEVSDVIDGDTIKLKDGKVIRLTGIDAPETYEPCYEQAKEKLKELVYRKTIRLESDWKDKDDYGRLLRYVFVDDLFVNLEMIRLGLARFKEIPPNKKYSDLFLETENKARRAGRCIWD